MLSQEQYTTAVFTATRANAALVGTLRGKEALGCYPKWNTAQCQQLKIKSGMWSLAMEDYSSEASVDIYNQLVDIGSTWFGGIAFDPNAQNPGGVEIINVTSVPDPIDFGWADFSTDGSGDGGINRVTYYNTAWAGWEPMLWLVSPGGTALFLGTDYELIVTGGFMLLPDGNLPSVVDGQVLRSTGYEKI